jgi:hypothetical protein
VREVRALRWGMVPMWWAPGIEQATGESQDHTDAAQRSRAGGRGGPAAGAHDRLGARLRGRLLARVPARDRCLFFRRAPGRAFRLVERTIKAGDAYTYDRLAADKAIALIERYLAEFREALAWRSGDTYRYALVLEALVRVG